MQTKNNPYFSVKGFFYFIGHLILIAFFGFLAREAWHGYQKEKQNTLFNKEGKLVPIVVESTTQEKKTWKDYIGNSKYIEFTYHNKPYSIRYVQDSGWVGPGTKVVLLYHEGLDDFIQPGLFTRRPPIYKTSKLVNFTVVSLFTNENIWLFGFVVLSLILIVFVSGVLANLTGLTIITQFMDVLLTVIFIAGIIYLTYDAYQYYSYAKKVKADAVAATVPMLDKYRDEFGNSHHSDDIEFFYFYSARVHYNNEDRVIPIGEEDYNNLKIGDALNVLYNVNIDEMTSANFSPSYSNGIFVGTLWILFLSWISQKFKRRKTDY